MLSQPHRCCLLWRCLLLQQAPLPTSGVKCTRAGTIGTKHLNSTHLQDIKIFKAVLGAFAVRSLPNPPLWQQLAELAFSADCGLQILETKMIPKDPKSASMWNACRCMRNVCEMYVEI